MKTFLSAPGFLSPYGTFGADLSSLLAWVFTLLFIYGGWLAGQHRGERHHIVTLWGMVAMLAYFTLYYLARGLGALSVEGKEGFGGPDWVYSRILKPILTVHITAVSLGLVLGIYMIILGFRASRKENKERVLNFSPLKMDTKWFTRILIGAALFFGVGAVIRWGSLARFLVYLCGFLIVAAVLVMERFIERWIPDGGKRHKKVGIFTIVLYVIALITSTITYVMLYYIYPVKPIG